jgi:hypothetical protein
LHFIEVPSADFAVARVAARVAAGGHDTPELMCAVVSTVAFNSFPGYTQSLVPEWYHWRTDSQGIHLVASHDQA